MEKLPLGLPQFAMVGAVGFAVDATVLNLMIFGAGWGLYSSRVVSFAVAVFATWLLNRLWTFRHRASANKTREYSSYVLIQGIGASLNFAIYSALIYFSPQLAAWPTIPLACGSATAMFFNFFAARHFVYTGK